MKPGVPEPDREAIERQLRKGLAMGRAGRHQDALAFFERVLRRDPGNTRALRGRAAVHVRAGAISEAAHDLGRVVELIPDCSACWFELGQIDMISGWLDRAREHLERCLSIDPEHAPAHSLLAGVEQRSGRYHEALDHISRALALRPDHSGDLHNRAVVLASLGRQAEAIREYESVLRREPACAGTLNNLAWLLATSRDPALRDCRKAIECARKAVASARCGAWLDTLATAHAECGEFERAVEIEAEACSLSRPFNPAFGERLELYRRGISYVSWLARRC